MVLKHFCFPCLFALGNDSGPILDRFWVPKSSQNRPQKALQRGWKSWSFFNAFSNLKKSIFWSTWLQHGSILPPKMAPSWDQNGVKIGPKTVSEARSAPGPILGRFWDPSWSILGRMLIDFGTIFGRFWKDFWVDSLVGFCVFLENSRENGGCVT